MTFYDEAGRRRSSRAAGVPPPPVQDPMPPAADPPTDVEGDDLSSHVSTVYDEPTNPNPPMPADDDISYASQLSQSVAPAPPPSVDIPQYRQPSLATTESSSRPSRPMSRSSHSSLTSREPPAHEPYQQYQTLASQLNDVVHSFQSHRYQTERQFETISEAVNLLLERVQGLSNQAPPNPPPEDPSDLRTQGASSRRSQEPTVDATLPPEQVEVPTQPSALPDPPEYSSPI